MKVELLLKPPLLIDHVGGEIISVFLLLIFAAVETHGWSSRTTLQDSSAIISDPGPNQLIIF